MSHPFLVKDQLQYMVRLMVLNATVNNISVISWRSSLLVKEIGIPWENHRSAASHWLFLLLQYRLLQIGCCKVNIIYTVYYLPFCMYQHDTSREFNYISCHLYCWGRPGYQEKITTWYTSLPNYITSENYHLTLYLWGYDFFNSVTQWIEKIAVFTTTFCLKYE